MNCYSIQNPSNGQTCDDDSLGTLTYNSSDGTWEKLEAGEQQTDWLSWLPFGGGDDDSISYNDSNNSKNRNVGEGFYNISSGIGNILSSIFGSNGFGDDIAAITYANKGIVPGPVRPVNYPPYGYASGNNIPWGMLLIGVAVIAGLFFLLRKK